MKKKRAGLAKKGRRLPLLEQFRHLKRYLQLGGIKLPTRRIYLILFSLTGLIDLFLLALIYNALSKYEGILGFWILITVLMLTLGLIAIFLIIWLMFLFYVDYMKFKRRTLLEEILPEYLRLVSANHRAGLPLDMALWKANRPRFGVLSDEINEVAKNTYASGDLINSLEQFGTKYDSPLLRRVISNIVEGLRTGSDLSSLLDDVSLNITTIRNTRKELASEVENYMLFITVTVLIISPLMFALTQKMAGIIESVKGSIAENLTGEAATQVPIPIGTDVAEEGARPVTFYFDIFVYLMIFTNSIMSVLLMSVVKYGTVKQEMKRIPVYYVISTVVYLLFKLIFRDFLAI